MPRLGNPPEGSWTYRIVRTANPAPPHYDYAIHEAYMIDGTLGVTVNAVGVVADTPEGLRDTMALMARAIGTPVLERAADGEWVEVADAG